MAAHQFSATARIAAPAQELYAIIADYRTGHPQILPRPPFVSLEVTQGGVGSGTAMRVQLRLLGRVQTFHATVTEPEPGRVLVETTDTGYVTSFTVVPHADGQASDVTIATELIGRSGIGGALEGWLVARLLRPVYVRELAQLAAVVAARAS